MSVCDFINREDFDVIGVDSSEVKNRARIVVVGVGGSGNNAINRMIDEGIDGVEFVGMNTDMMDLQLCKAPKVVQLGEKLTRGLGAGSDATVGEAAARESADAIAEAIEGADMLFITCGMGGGTGTGAAPVVAEIAKSVKDKEILTVGIVTKPFTKERLPRMRRAVEGIEKLYANVDSLIVIPNDKVLEVGRDLPIQEGFRKVDEILHQAVRGISELITHQGDINVDFADIRAAMLGKGLAHIGIGVGKGEKKAEDAVRNAVESPLLETRINSAHNIVANVTGDITVDDYYSILDYFGDLVGDEIEIKLGLVVDKTMSDSCVVTVIATGVDNPEQNTVGQRPPLPGMAAAPARPQPAKPAGPAVVYPTHGVTPQARPVSPAAGVTTNPILSSNIGTGPIPASAIPGAAVTPAASPARGTEAHTPAAPAASTGAPITSKVKENHIKVPDFLSNRK